MDASLVQPYQHLARMLITFAGSMRSSQPAGGAAVRWSRVVAQLDQDLRGLRSSGALRQSTAGAPPDYAALKKLALRLTQLARAQDGLRFEQSAAVPADQLVGERRLVVLAAWQLHQALEQTPPAPQTAHPAPQTSVAR